MRKSSACRHGDLQLDVSAHAGQAEFARPPPAKRIAAATPSGRVEPGQGTAAQALTTTFPGPLVLPDDDLASDPACPPQSLRSWLRDKNRNPLTAQRKTLYLAATPRITRDVAFMTRWAAPKHQPRSQKPLASPSAADVAAYLRAFYHPLEVRLLPQTLSFVSWDGEDDDGDATATDQHVGLREGSPPSAGVTRIRTRACPDDVFARQLNLNDVLDAADAALPADAYALLILTDQDLFEDDDDDFCCGRAYGASRVAVVSAARYHPHLDDEEEVEGGCDARAIDRRHMWPASHCKEYVDRLCSAAVGGEMARGGKKKKGGKAGVKAGVIDLEHKLAVEATPLGAAVEAARATSDLDVDLGGLWLSRVARTTVHELGHCFCLDHCVYYACVMQGTAGLAEDAKQPPYLCPVCLKKLTRALADVVGKRDADEGRLVADRYAALAMFCEAWPRVAMFAGFRAWLEKRLESLASAEPV